MFDRLLCLLATLIFFASTAFAYENSFFYLSNEPLIRIGLETNARSVSITTADTSLVALSPDEPNRLLATNKVLVAPRAYRPPEIEIYRFELRGIETAEEAAAIAADIREATGEKAVTALDAATNTWKIAVGETKATIEEANQYKLDLADKGFEEIEIVTEKRVQPSDEAVALTQQLKQGGKTEVRSLVKPTGASAPTAAADVDRNLKEILVSGASETARFSSFKPLAFGSVNERAVPVKLNGKSYRGRIEVFVNSRGTLTVVNVVPLEDYLLGVVPNELGLPSLEAQKAQAVAARTYAVANINGFATQGFDLLPTVRSQVYRGVSSENSNGTHAVTETRGVVATYKGKPINAYYTSTCGGRTENSENVFDTAEPYLRGVECSLEGRRHFEPFLVKTSRLPARLRDEKYLSLVRLMSQFAVNNFQLATAQMNDDWFDEEPTQSELSNWLNNVALRFNRTFPNVNKETAKPVELARVLAQIVYGDAAATDTLLSDSDVNYQLSFDDAAEIPKERRADLAALLRDGYFAIYPDLTLKPQKGFTRAKILRIIEQIYAKKKWLPVMQTGVAEASENGAFNLRQGRTKRTFAVRPDVFLFRQFGDDFYQVREAALVGGETVVFQTDASGAVIYLEIKPSPSPTVAERMSPFTMWNVSLTPSAVQSRLSRYVRGIGALYDVRIKRRGYSRRAVELEIVGSNGTKYLKGGRIRSALRLREQLFVLNKRYDGAGRAIAYSFTGRGWGHGVGMCQYGAFGLGKMGLKYDAILKHYYTGIDLTKAY